MAQYLARDHTERQLIHVSDEEAAAYRDQGWVDATSEEIDTWRRNDVYGGLQGHPPPPPLSSAVTGGAAAGGVPGTAAPAPQAGETPPWAPQAADEEQRAQADADAAVQQQVEAKTRLVPFTLPGEVSPAHPPLTEGEPAPGSSLAQAQAAGQLPAEAISGDLSVPEQGDAAATPGPGGATVFPQAGDGSATEAAAVPTEAAAGAPAEPSPGLFGAPADPARDTAADEAPATDEHTV